jgi:muramoyltetrapeptide carboxypeptidase
MTYPPPLQPGDTIGVMATSCWLEEADLLAAKSFFEEMGYNVFLHPQATARLNQSAGSAQEKVDAFHELFSNQDIKAIFGARGGNRAITMMDKIDWDIVKSNPKIFMGYSDLTQILHGIYKHTGMVTYHGPLFRELPNRKEFVQVMALLGGDKMTIPLPDSKVLQAGTAEGKLFGGNLSVFQTLVGTENMPDLSGGILILEDIGDHLSRYDRMLAHLRTSGILGQLSALIIGEFVGTQDDEDRPFGFTFADVIRQHTNGLDIPVIMDAPFGHGDNLPAFPIGAPVKPYLERPKLGPPLTVTP